MASHYAYRIKEAIRLPSQIRDAMENSPIKEWNEVYEALRNLKKALRGLDGINSNSNWLGLKWKCPCEIKCKCYISPSFEGGAGTYPKSCGCFDICEHETWNCDNCKKFIDKQPPNEKYNVGVDGLIIDREYVCNHCVNL